MNRLVRMSLLGAAASLTLAGASASFAADNSTSHSMKSSGTASKTAMQSNASSAAKTPMVGGAPMYPSKTIVQNASTANNLTTLVSAVKEAGLVDTLSGSGPFTVFAPTNAAFDKLPKSTVANLMKPANKDQLKTILTYHVLSGDLTKSQLQADLKKGNGSTTFKTVEGTPLTITEKNGKMMIKDAKGHTARIVQSDVKQSNGTVYVIGSVLMPS